MAALPGPGNLPAGRYFLKMHGLENHFVIVDARHEPFRPAAADVVRICNARTGIGADQLIVIEPARSAHADAFMRILNVDGREVEACGNATRCVAWLLLEEARRDAVMIETLAGPLACRRAGHEEVSVEMGRISTDWRDVPLAGERDTLHVELPFDPLRDGVALSVGNPHVVFFVPDLDAVDIESVAPRIQAHPLFPEQVNVGVAQVLSDDAMRLKVFERGAGLTTACGSGACAATRAAQLRGLTTQRSMTVEMPAGRVSIEIDEHGAATMTGPVAHCFSGYLP